jgi:GNAT superfamily N-acetyltransferase
MESISDTMTAVYARESFDVFWPAAQRLIEKHFQEIAAYPDIPLNPDRDFYDRCEVLGSLRIYTARLEHSGWLVGYAVFFVNPNPHYASSLQATADVVYLDPAWRGGGMGTQLIAYSELQLQEESVEVIYHHVKADHLTLALILERRGYEVMDIVMALRVGERGRPGRGVRDLFARLKRWFDR